MGFWESIEGLRPTKKIKVPHFWKWTGNPKVLDFFDDKEQKEGVNMLHILPKFYLSLPFLTLSTL